MTPVGVCDECGIADGGHAPSCSRWQTMSAYEILKGQKDAILANQKARGDAPMKQLEGTLMGKLRRTEAERDAARLQVSAVAVVLETWKADQYPLMSREVAELIGEIEKSIKWPDHAALLQEASRDIARETKTERDRFAMQLEAAQAALRDAIASNTTNGEERAAALAQLETARGLLMDCWHQLDGDVYVLPGGEVHPGAVTTIHDLHAFLWPEGKTI